MDDNDLARIHRARSIVKQTDELLGLIKGALLDGALNEREASGIHAWLRANPYCLEEWPGCVLFERLTAALRDGRLDADELEDLYGLMLQIASPVAPSSAGEIRCAPSTLPLSAPPFEIVYPGRSFCFTGVFEYGSRQQCHQAVSERGGLPAAGITKRLDYLVIGNIGSDFWLHSSFGTKIKKAVDYREAGASIVIVSEATWRETLG